MSGSPLKHERNRLVREAILRGLESGVDPVTLLLPYTDKLKRMALDGDPESPTTLAAMKEIFDRVDGKAAQEVVASGETGKLVDAGLVGFAGDMLRLIAARGLAAPMAEERVTEGEVLEKVDAPRALGLGAG